MKQSKLFFSLDKSVTISQLSISIQLLQLYNVRAIEILNASWDHFNPEQFLILIGAKKSSNIIVRDRYILFQIDKLPRTDAVKIFPNMTYSILYHHCKKYYSHLFVKFKGKKNFKVTHGFRYKNVSQFDNDEIIRDILHHRSIKSGKFYKTKGVISNETSKKV